MQFHCKFRQNFVCCQINSCWSPLNWCCSCSYGKQLFGNFFHLEFHYFCFILFFEYRYVAKFSKRSAYGFYVNGYIHRIQWYKRRFEVVNWGVFCCLKQKMPSSAAVILSFVEQTSGIFCKSEYQSNAQKPTLNLLDQHQSDLRLHIDGTEAVPPRTGIIQSILSNLLR